MDAGLKQSWRSGNGQPALMGIVNVTPDSFSDGGEFCEHDAAISHGLRLLEEGAHIVDVGGESTRPGSSSVAEQEELERVVPVIRGIRQRCPTALISVDTSKARVAEAAIAAGARMINDVSALGDPEMAQVCASNPVYLVLMHMRGRPRYMQRNTEYDDLVGEVADFLHARMDLAERCGMKRAQLVIDPGIGFGKALDDNALLIRGIARLRELGAPVLIGASRKRFIGHITAVENAKDRIFGSIGAALASAAHGADILRVHDVQATRHALSVFHEVGLP